MPYEQWDVALAAFPFSESARTKFRPVLILSATHFNLAQDMAVSAMITTASGGRWASDHAILDLEAAGLQQNCVVRFKIATLAAPLIDRRIGSLSRSDRDRLQSALQAILPLAPKA